MVPKKGTKISVELPSRNRSWQKRGRRTLIMMDREVCTHSSQSAKVSSKIVKGKVNRAQAHK